jgi:hypothetical protein
VIEAGDRLVRDNLYKYQKCILITITFTWFERFKLKIEVTFFNLRKSIDFNIFNLKPCGIADLTISTNPAGLPILPYLLRQMPSRIGNYSATTSSL